MIQVSFQIVPVKAHMEIVMRQSKGSKLQMSYVDYKWTITWKMYGGFSTHHLLPVVMLETIIETIIVNGWPC